MKQFLMLTPNGEFKEIDKDKYEDSYKMLCHYFQEGFDYLSGVIANGDTRYDIWVNRLGKINNLPISLGLRKGEKIVDVICGDIIFSKFDYEGNTLPLSEDDIEYIKNLIMKEKRFVTFVNHFCDGIPVQCEDIYILDV